MEKFTCLDTYCSLSYFWTSKDKLAKILEIDSKDQESKSNLLFDLSWLVNIGYIEKRVNERGRLQYRLSDNLEKARRKYRIKRAI